MDKEKDFYSKVFVASSLRFITGEANKNHVVTEPEDKFARSLAVILARDKEVVAVKLTISDDSCEVCLSKNEDWLPKDIEYVNRIEEYLMNISKNAPKSMEEAMKRKDVKDLYNNIIAYCDGNLQSRMNKLDSYITAKWRNKHIKDFKKHDYLATKLGGCEKSKSCMDYYKKIKNDNNVPAKFLRHIRKVGTYAVSFNNIIKCACLKKFKTPFSNIIIDFLLPSKKTLQSINSWENVIQEFIPDVNNNDKYNDFKDRCLSDININSRLKDIYDDIDEPPKNRCDVFLHAEMNILTHIMKDENKKKTFIAVSKSCCYLCELYINYANTSKGYDIVIVGTHKKLYRGWMLPSTGNITFDDEFRKHIQKELEQIIEDEIENIQNRIELKAGSDGECYSPDSEGD